MLSWNPPDDEIQTHQNNCDLLETLLVEILIRINSFCQL